MSKWAHLWYQIINRNKPILCKPNKLFWLDQLLKLLKPITNLNPTTKINSTKTTSVISTIWPHKKWKIPWCPINKNLKKLSNINKSNHLQPHYSQLNNQQTTLLNKTNSMTKTTSLTSMIWPHKKWKIPWYLTIMKKLKLNLQRLLNKKTNTSHLSRINPHKKINLSKATTLTLSTAWLRKRWTTPWYQTTKTRLFNGLKTTTKTPNQISKLNNKDSAISRTTTHKTCLSHKSPLKNNKCSLLISSLNLIHLDWTIWLKRSRIYKIFSEWRRSCPVTFCWPVKEKLKLNTNPIMTMSRKTSMR